jgi:hypothetical protein
MAERAFFNSSSVKKKEVVMRPTIATQQIRGRPFNTEQE